MLSIKWGLDRVSLASTTRLIVKLTVLKIWLNIEAITMPIANQIKKEAHRFSVGSVWEGHYNMKGVPLRVSTFILKFQLVL